jgi:hypothetical protein
VITNNRLLILDERRYRLKLKPVSILLFIVLMAACQSRPEREDLMTFNDDLEFLKQYADTVLLSDSSGRAQVVVSAGMQGRVLTSTASGGEGISFGWINYEDISSGVRDPHFNPFGGEDRFWLGPEGGQYALYFAKDQPFDLENWYVPAEFDWDRWEVVDQTGEAVTFEKEMTLTNYSGFTFDMKVIRVVQLLDEEATAQELNLDGDIDVQSVAFESINSVNNTGDKAWKKETGLVSIWILGMYPPSPQKTIVIPFKTGPEKVLGPVVNDEYFGKVSADRLVIKDGNIYFKSDGEKRSKIGVPPERCLFIAGSYDAVNQVLTVVKTSPPAGSGGHPYVNSLWELQENPYGGDVINAYNDGPPAPGVEPLGPFYELETSSPGAQLNPGESLKHRHMTFHFQGDQAELDKISRKLFSVSLQEIKSIFN